jgi:hypothetical protein
LFFFCFLFPKSALSSSASPEQEASMPYRPENDPFKEEYVPPPTPAQPRRPQIAWRRGAVMWADGEELSTICAALGIDEDRFWRHVRNSQRFRFLIQQAGERRRLQAQFRLAREGREALLRAMAQIEKYDPATLRWLGEQAGLESGMPGNGMPGNGTLAGDAPAPQRADAGERLRLAASPPPNQAFRKRIATQRAKMDAEVARMEQSFARRQVAEAARLQQNQQTHSEQNQDLSDAKPSQNDAKPVQAAAPSPISQQSAPPKPRANPAAWQPPPRPPRPPAPPPPRSRAELLGTIIDLPGPDMHRIRYAKDPDPDEEMETS